MIEIITTRFREAYTWIVPTEHERLQNGGFIKERPIHSFKKFSNELHKSFSLEQEIEETHVIILFISLCYYDSDFMVQQFLFQSHEGCRKKVDSDASSVLPSHGLVCQDCTKNLHQVK